MDRLEAARTKAPRVPVLMIMEEHSPRKETRNDASPPKTTERVIADKFFVR